MTLPSVPTAPAAVRPTPLSHGGECGCNIALGVHDCFDGEGFAAEVDGKVRAWSTVDAAG